MSEKTLHESIARLEARQDECYGLRLIIADAIFGNRRLTSGVILNGAAFQA
jgi:hypothetical protein